MKIVFEAIEKQIATVDMLNGEYYLSITNNYLQKVLCYPFIEKFYQFGTPKNFEYTKEKLRMSANLINEQIDIDNTVILSAGRGKIFLNLNFFNLNHFYRLVN